MEKVNEKGEAVENGADGIKKERVKALYGNYKLPELLIFDLKENRGGDHQMASLCGDSGTADW